MDRWTEMALFVQTAEAGSLSRAAEALGLSNAAASRHLASLEERLGSRLMTRNSRRLSLTDTGEIYYHRCKAILADLREADLAVNASMHAPMGTLRITASLSFAMHHIAPLLRDYTALYPGVSVQVVAHNRYYDLIDNNIDIAIRTREYESDSSITIRPLAETRRILAASPGYLSRRGTPQSIDELAGHDVLLYSLSNKPDELMFTRGDERRSIKIRSLLEANDGQVLRAAALDGLGILVQPKYILYEDIVAGRLVPVLDAWDLPRLRINIAFQSRRHMSAKVRTFIDFIVAHFRAMDYERKWTT
jgi:DNA-binding transcriptional LysR family regulator